jgi:tetratricopeptide (TPR) repeat protein
VRYLSRRERLPLNARAGVAWGFTAGENENTLTIDAMKERSMPVQFGAGAETVFAKALAVRAGFSKRNDAGVGVTAGLGWTLGGLSIDYAIVPYGDLGLTHRISATVRWGKKPAEDYNRPAKHRKSDWNAKDAPRDETVEEHFRLAVEHRKAGYYRLARQELEKASDLMDSKDQRMVFYYEQLGYIAWLKKEVAVARDFYTEALKLAMTAGLREPVVAEAYTGLAMCAYEDGDRSYALKVFKKALEANPSRKTKDFIDDKIIRIMREQQ